MSKLTVQPEPSSQLLEWIDETGIIIRLIHGRQVKLVTFAIIGRIHFLKYLSVLLVRNIPLDMSVHMAKQIQR